MQDSSENFLPILFNILFGFVALNTLINAVLLLTRARRLNKLLAIYWPSLFLLYLFQGQINAASNLTIVFAYSVGCSVSLLMGMIAFEAVGRRFPLKSYLVFLFPFYPITLGLDLLSQNFTIVAMPFAIATAIPMLHGSYYLLVGSNGPSTNLQKILGIIYSLHAIHCINFALFRMDPGAQLWGWIVSYTLCDLLAILLPSIALEEASLTEEERLKKSVNEKTENLSRALKVNDTLLKVLLHDISNPLMAMQTYLQVLRKNPEKTGYLEKIEKSQKAIDQIFFQIRNLHQKGIVNELDNKVSLEKCFRDVAFIFEQQLKNKDISLRFTSGLNPHTFVKANSVTLTYNVLSNLVSNSLKYAPPHSEIVVSASEKNDNIILEVMDNGTGIPLDVIERLREDEEIQSTPGSMGEVGSGFGLTIVKSFVNSFGGKIEFDSAYTHRQVCDYGTKVRITLDRA